MKRTTIVLSAAALAALSAPAFGDRSQDVFETGWPLILGNQPTSLTDVANTRQTTSRRAVLGSTGTCNGLNDNGPFNGINGYSNATEGVFGERRTMLDDFEVPNGEAWTINELHHTHVWDTSDPGSGVGMELAIWSDSGGVPDRVIVDTLVSISYTESATGNIYFSRPEAVTWAGFDPIVLDAGRYWFEATIIGPENNFWLTADQIDEECWINYADGDPPLMRGSQQFGEPSDVNWCLGGTRGEGSTNQFGLRHAPRGEAHLDGTGGTLTVSNIGSSGEDGLSVELGNTSGGWLGHAAAPAGGDMVVTAVGVRNGSPDIAFGSTTTTFGTLTTISMDLTGLDATTYTRNLYLDDSLVDSQSGLPSGAAAASTADVITGGECLAMRRPNNVIYVVRLDLPVDVTAVGMADEIQMIPDAPTTGIGGITSVDVTLSDTGDLVIDDGALVMFGNENRRTGIAKITTVDGVLRVSNLGSSGEDGVRIDIDDAEAVDVTFDPIVVSIGLDEFNQTATGRFGETEGSDLGRSSIINGSGFTVLQVDFAPISVSNEVLIELYDDGTLVGDVVRSGGGNTMFVFSDGINPVPTLSNTGATPIASPGYYYQFDGDVDLRTGISPATSIGVGDEILVLANDPDLPVSALDSYSITSSIGPALIITGEGPVCDSENGDTNGDGCVDFADLRAVVGAWNEVGEPGFLGDADCDGLVSFADIVLVLSTWDENCT